MSIFSATIRMSLFTVASLIVSAAQAQQGPKQEDAAPFRPGRRGRPFAQTAQAQAFGPHEIAFDDVVGGVAEHHHACADRAGGVRDQPVARGAGRRGQAGRRFVAGPGQ